MSAPPSSIWLSPAEEPVGWENGNAAERLWTQRHTRASEKTASVDLKDTHVCLFAIDNTIRY